MLGRNFPVRNLVFREGPWVIVSSGERTDMMLTFLKAGAVTVWIVCWGVTRLEAG